MHFDAGVYTNLSQDHLDIHKDFEHYARAKQMLFGISEKSIINTDDAWSGTMKEGVKGKLLTYSLMGDADFTAKDIRLDVSGTEFTLGWNGNEKKIDLMIPGRFMVYNALAAAAACLSVGIDIEDVVLGLRDVKGVAGRFEKLDTKGRDFSVILDYAHTPDSLKNILESVRHFSKGRVVCLFGCGGNRDRAKRPKMGEITEELADLAIVTTDNPRFEEPGDIINEILSGMKKDNHVVIENRLEAIKYALDNARKDDIIILAGKGHEYYQEIKGVRYHFNEKEIVDELLD
jgi:UDP-N-acetylmuramoyl-L-alanyl-D-glutamate--2,6-diaminopimelate ligase